MATWSPNTAQIIDNGFGSSRQGWKIHGAALHHVAGLDGLGYVAHWNERDSHPTYHVDKNGKQSGIVHPDRRPHSTASDIDLEAVSFEIDNISTGGDWPVSGEAIETVIETCVYHARQTGLKKAERNKPGVAQPDAFFIAWHSQYHATACPGPDLSGKIDYIVSEITRRLQGAAPKPKPNPTPKPKPKPTPKPKSVDQVADEVLAGKWGNDPQRSQKLRAAGYDPVAVQNRVNEKLYGKKPVGKSVDTLADEVYRGVWGNDPERSQKLRAAGYDPVAVQRRVNEKYYS